jgi:hypothetical protein
MEVRLPRSYYLERDPDLIVLRRGDSRRVAAFSARGAAREEIEKAAWEDLRGSRSLFAINFRQFLQRTLGE